MLDIGDSRGRKCDHLRRSVVRERACRLRDVLFPFRARLDVMPCATLARVFRIRQRMEHWYLVRISLTVFLSLATEQLDLPLSF